MKKFFSIIVPVYNVEMYLEDCVNSILKQTFTDFEIILVDDGSPDQCPQICDEYAKIDDRIKVIHKENGGLSSARNSGMRRADGEYFVFVDSDDALLDDNALARIHVNLKEKNYPDVMLKKPKINKLLDEYKGTELLPILINNGFCVTVWDKIYKQDFIKLNNLYFREGYVHEDVLWTIITLANANKCTFIDEQFYMHNVVENSIVQSRSEKSILNRAVSKMNNAITGAEYFMNSNFDERVKTAAYKFYIGIYLNGITEGITLKEPKNEFIFNDEAKKTLKIMEFARKTDNKKYMLFGNLYRIFGKKSYIFMKMFLKRKYLISGI